MMVYLYAGLKIMSHRIRTPITLLVWALIFSALLPMLAFSVETNLEDGIVSQDDLDDLVAEAAISEEESGLSSGRLLKPGWQMDGRTIRCSGF